MYYFGEWPEKSVDPGKYLFNTSGFKIQYQYTPWGNQVQRIAPSDTNIAGKARVAHKDKWTSLSFWHGDRGDFSVFFAEGTKNFEEMCSLASEKFPDVWSKYTFEVKEWKD